jgi:hypothetical protein
MAGWNCPQAPGTLGIGPGEANVALFGGNRHKSAIEDGEALVAFMDAEAEALACGTVDDYTRARARIDADGLFAQPRFAAILAIARAEAYPIALTMVAETVESTLALEAGDRAARLGTLLALARSVFVHHPVPQSITAPAWTAAGAATTRWLGEATRHPPRTTDDIAEPFAASLLALMPIHDDLGPDNYPFLRKSIRAMLAAVRERFIINVNAPILAATLTRRRLPAS